jgi:hypothetical protein
MLIVYAHNMYNWYRVSMFFIHKYLKITPPNFEHRCTQKISTAGPTHLGIWSFCTKKTYQLINGAQSTRGWLWWIAWKVWVWAYLHMDCQFYCHGWKLPSEMEGMISYFFGNPYLHSRPENETIYNVNPRFVKPCLIGDTFGFWKCFPII